MIEKKIMTGKKKGRKRFCLDSDDVIPPLPFFKNKNHGCPGSASAAERRGGRAQNQWRAKDETEKKWILLTGYCFSTHNDLSPMLACVVSWSKIGWSQSAIAAFNLQFSRIIYTGAHETGIKQVSATLLKGGWPRDYIDQSLRSWHVYNISN